MIRSSVIVRDRGWKRIKRQLSGKRISAEIGLHEPEQAMRAAVNEFGSSDALVPERSFMRAAFDQSRREYIQFMRRLVRGVLEGRTSLHAGMMTLGERAAQDQRDQIDAISTPPNSPATQKQGSDPLIDSGEMRGAIASKVKGRG